MTGGQQWRLAEMLATDRKGRIVSKATTWPVWRPVDKLQPGELESAASMAARLTGDPGGTEQWQKIIQDRGEVFSLQNLLGDASADIDNAAVIGRAHPDATALLHQAYGIGMPAAVAAPAPTAQQNRAASLGQALQEVNDPVAAPALKPPLSPDPWEGSFRADPLPVRPGPDTTIAGPLRSVAIPGSHTTAPLLQVDGAPDVPGNALLITSPAKPGVAVTVPDGADVAARGGDTAPAVIPEVEALKQDILDNPAAPPVKPTPVRAKVRARRSARQQAAAEAGPETENIDAAGLAEVVDNIFSAPDFGIGGLSSEAMRKAAENLNIQGLPKQAQRLRRLALLTEVSLPAAATVASIGVPLAMAAGAGNEAAGGGGGLVQGGGALLGSLVGAGRGPPGRHVGGLIGGGIGGAVVGAGRSAVDAANAGDTGIVGGIGNALDPLLDSQRDIEERQLRAQLNSPIVRQMKEQERQDRHNQMMEAMQAALYQSYLK
jgi:hypothetical protein